MVQPLRDDLSFLGLVTPPPGLDTMDATLAWGQAEGPRLREALTRHGALLLRGFPLRETTDFGAFFRTQESEAMGYDGGFTVRQSVPGEVYTSTGAPPMVSIPLHAEMAYSQHYPHRVYLWCRRPAARGGQTPLADAREVLRRADPALVQRLRPRGLRYIRNLPPEPGRIWPPTGWRKAFSAQSQEEAEAAAIAAGYAVEWFGDMLRLSAPGPLTRTHPRTGEEAWFNQLHNFHHSNSAEFLQAGKLAFWALFRWIETRDRWRLPEDRLTVSVTDGEGEPITREEALSVRRTLWECARRFTWEAGDLLILDNHLVLHGRDPYAGERQVYAALARD